MTNGARAEVYRARATECEAAAARATDPTAKAGYMDLANKWRNLAHLIVTIEREPPTP